LREWEYATRALDYGSIHPVAKETTYQSTEGDLAPAFTRWSYDDWYEDTFQIKQRTTTLPVIPEGQNGSGEENQFIEIFDEFNHQEWLRNEREFLTYSEHDPVTGALKKRIEDVDTDILPAPNEWKTPDGGGLHLVSDYEFDDLGRQTQSLGPEHEVDLGGEDPTPIRLAEWTLYQDEAHREWRSSGYVTGSSGSYSYTLVNPVSITLRDLSGRVTDQIQAKVTPESVPLGAGEELPSQDAWSRWQKSHYDDQGHQVWDRRYVLIPDLGEGLPGANYNETSYGYDVRGRRIRTMSPGGTIQRTVLNARGWQLENWVGTNDNGATVQNPSGAGAAGNNMVQVTARQFDQGADGGNGNLTQVTAYPAADDPRVTVYGYDFRNRRVTADGEIDFFEAVIYDNLDRSIRVDRHNTTAAGTLIGREETGYDNLGRVYARCRYAVNVATGVVDEAHPLVELTWYDPTGNPMRIRPMDGRGCNKRSYDGVNRVIRKYVATDPASGSYERASSVTNDTVLRQVELTYDRASNLIFTIERQRFHNATGLGELKGPHDADHQARVSYDASYPDPLGRQIATANFGTNGGESMTPEDRPGTVPTPSAIILVSLSTYNDEGELFETTDPAGKVDRQSFDDAGQLLETVENAQDVGGDPDVNKTTTFAYNGDGRMITLTAVNVDTDNQITQWIYGTTLADSNVASHDLVRRKIYPDSGVDEYGYDATGALQAQADQNGTERAFLYDKLGRLTDDCVLVPGSGVDETVLRISRTYEVRGMLETITSADDPTPGTGTVVNQVQFAYNDFAQEITEYQAHGGIVNTSTTPKVQYAYVDGTNNTNRRTSITYPNGRVIGFTYGATDSPDDLLNRITNITDNSTSRVQYARLGVETVVQVQYQEPGYEMTFIDQPGGSDDGGDQYTGLDRFNRVIDILWIKPGATPQQLERLKYGFDPASNRVWRKEAVAPSGGFDEQYSYDGLYQLATRKRGTLSGGSISSPNQVEDFTYDPTGNWPAYELTDNGVVVLDQTREHNPVNEITAITNLPSTPVATAYDPAGNMTTMPKVGAWTTGQTLTWDAWNRLTAIVEGSTSIGAYQYDGLTRRTRKVSAPGGTATTRHYYYSDQWQILEERLGSATTADRQFIWGIRSIDDLVLRDRAGTTPSRLYALRDKCNITGVTDASAAVQERYAYTAFGNSFVLDPDFDPLSGSAFDWETRFGSYRFDPESLLYQVRYRYLQSELGRWLSRDPITDIKQLIKSRVSG
jgi:RHS repeat-associated protein